MSGIVAPVIAGLAVGIAFVIAFAMAWEGDAGEGTTLTVEIRGEPQQSLVQTGQANSLMTTYLPVKLTQTINLTGPTENMTLYPIFADWDGIIREGESSIIVENDDSVSYSGFGTAVLHLVNATCTEPYFVQVNDSGGSEDGGVPFEKTQAPVSSIIPWGDTFGVRFGEQVSGTIYYTQAYGIVPADYNNNNDDTARNNGAGNQEISGEYHLSFASLYPATIDLPEQATMTSSIEISCAINNDSTHVSKFEFPRIFVYDIRFEMPAGSD